MNKRGKLQRKKQRKTKKVDKGKMGKVDMENEEHEQLQKEKKEAKEGKKRDGEAHWKRHLIFERKKKTGNEENENERKMKTRGNWK